MTILYFLGMGLFGTLGLFWLLKIPFNTTNILIGAVMVALFTSHMMIACLVVFGVLYIKEKIKEKFFSKNKDNSDEK